jgi:hypothetical protein
MVIAVRDRLLLIGTATVLTAGMAAGCAKPRAHVEPEPPPLSAPPPPTRLLPPLAGGPIEGASPPPPPDTGAPPAPARRRAESSRPSDSQRETRPAEPPRADVPLEGQRQPGDAAAPLQPAPVLQLTPATESNASEQTIRQVLSRATQDLSHVDYVALSADAKAQYDTAKRFMSLADQAIKDRNMVFARTLADKAAVIAGVLSNR